MKVNPAGAYQYYKAYQAASGGEAVAAKRETAAKTDTVLISGKGAQSGALARLSQDITAQLETSTPKARIQALQAAVEKNEYRIPTEQLVDSIFGALGVTV